MNRKSFLKNGLTAISAGIILPISTACSKSEESITPSDNSSSNSGSTGGTTTNGTCTVAPSETAGPFPTKSPSSLLMNNITSDRKGIPFTINITINNKNSNCAALANAIVDIWHCDADGYYSEYGGSGVQQVNLTSVHFLRGRQVTNASGLVTFTSIFPGWYPGRAPHIHVQIYDVNGKSLLTTQIAFPTDVCDKVYSTATSVYTKGTQDTANTRDNVFSDSLASELASISGDLTKGFTLTHLITVSA